MGVWIMINGVLTSEINWDEFDRQCVAHEYQCDANSPLKSCETFEPCLRGCDKLKEDTELKDLLRQVYRGE